MASADVLKAERPARTALKRSRSEADLPSTPDSHRGSKVDDGTQSKRQKVSFSPTVSVRVTSTALSTTAPSDGDDTDEPLSAVREKVRLALAQHRQGNDAAYNRLKELFLTHPRSAHAPSRTAYRRHLAAVGAHALQLGRQLECAGLLRALLGSYWLERDEGVWGEFQRFLAALLTAHAVYVPTILGWLVDRFGETGAAEVAGVARAVVNDRIHRTIIGIARYVPGVEALLEEAIRAGFPFYRAKAETYLAFIRNILEVATYLPLLGDRILRLILEKMVVIDASISVSLEELDEEEIEVLNEQVRQDMVALFSSDALNFHEASENVEHESDNEDDDQELDRLLKHVKEDMLKLDCTMSILFKHYHAALSQDVANKVVIDGRSSLEASSAYDSILFAFMDVVLTTHNSRHSQFLLFRFAQLQDEFFYKYTDALLNITFDKHGSLPLRLAALSYLASFLARGAKISNDKVVLLFDRFGKELDKLRRKHEVGTRGPDPELYHFYYALFQACMYIFCFRWQAFVIRAGEYDDDEEEEEHDAHNSLDRRWHPGLKELFSQHMHSPLNPLKVCASMVVAAFAKMTQCLGLLYVYSILEANKRVRLTRVVAFNSVARETALATRGGGSEETLKVQAHFAFEPYALPVSRKWVEGLYLTFDMVTPPEYADLASDDDDDEEEEEEDDDDDNDDENDINDEEVNDHDAARDQSGNAGEAGEEQSTTAGADNSVLVSSQT